MQNSETNSANSANVTENTPKASNTPTRAKPSRKIDAEVLAQMATAVARMLTESEAARLCGIEPAHWFQWKSRHKRAQKFAALLEECRGARIHGLIARIEKSADGVDTKQPDFRAALALLKFTDQRRFGDSEAASQPQVGIVVLDDGMARRMAEIYARPVQQLATGAGQVVPAGTGYEDAGGKD
jgi:hypothetical protein